MALIAAFLESGWAVDIVTSHAGYMGETRDVSRANVDIEREGRLAIHRLPLNVRHRRDRQMKYIAFVAASIRYLRYVQKAEVIFCSSPPLTQVVPAIVAALYWRAPIVLEVRDLWPEVIARAGLIRSRGILLCLRWLEAIAYHLADSWIVTAPAHGDYLVAMGMQASRGLIAPSGGDPRPSGIDVSAAERWRNQLAPRGQFIVVYAGSLNEAYDIPLLLAAAESAEFEDPDTIWVFAGDGRERSRVLSAARLHPNVRYVGVLPRDEIPGLCASADIGIASHADWPLLDSCISGKLFDYMAASLPVVVVRPGQMSIAVEQACAGLTLSSANSSELVCAVRQLASMDQDDRHAMGARGREWMLRHANRDAEARRVARHVTDAYMSARIPNAASRFLGAAIPAASDVARKRARTAAETFVTARRLERIENAFARWQANARSEPDKPPLRVPRILSSLPSLDC